MTRVHLLMSREAYEGEKIVAIFTSRAKASRHARATMKRHRGKKTDDGCYGLRWSNVYDDWATVLWISTWDVIE